MIQVILRLKVGKTQVEGESRYDGRVGELELISFRWESRAEGPDPNRCNRLVIWKPAGRATPTLARMCVTREEFPHATLSALTISARRPVDFYRVRLSGLRVVSLAIEAHELDQNSAASGEGRLVEEVAFEFSSAETTWHPPSRDGLPDAPLVESGIPANPGLLQAGDPDGELLRQAAAMGFDIRPPVGRRW